MEASQMNLVLICAVAFAAVVAILSILAGIISAICRVFPVNAADLPDPGAEEAVRQAVAKAFPDCRVAEIREIKP
ncbi:MAG: hypothetical protein QF600_00590 [Verrucomicrobiota bacterium]|jgi:hypothetical protein|nr:hypothetical protein [Verrucomicrobiota bacterium]